MLHLKTNCLKCVKTGLFFKRKAMAKQKYRFVDVDDVGSLMHLLLGINILAMHEGC